MKKLDVQMLAESTLRRSRRNDAPELLKKWSQVGLLEGLRGQKRETMALLLENQAAEVLKESNGLSTGGASLVSSGKVAGFSNVAFPIVRRVFGSLIANELVSVQPMSLPSGLLFYLDYTYGSNVGGVAGVDLNPAAASRTYNATDSVYNNPAGAGVRSGSLATGGQYDLVGAGYSKVHKNSTAVDVAADGIGYWASGSIWTPAATVDSDAVFLGLNARFVDYDAKVEADLAAGALDYVFVHVSASAITTAIVGADLASIEQVAVTAFATNNSVAPWGEQYQGGTGVFNLRKLNKRGDFNPVAGTFTPNPTNGTHVQLVVRVANAGAAPAGGNATVSAAISDALSVNADGSTLTIPSFETNFAVDASARIPDLDIKIESTSVTATTRKLRARWSPEMAQDLTAFYSMDIETELTNILSEHVTLEIDREVLQDLLTQAGAANLYWSRAPGKFVNKVTGAEALQSGNLAPGPQMFAHTPADWYQTLLETITDVANTIHKKTLRGSGNFVVTSPDVCTMLEHLVAYKPSMSVDSDGQVAGGMGIGAEVVGQLQNRYTVYKDPYFPTNKVLVGLKGGTFLETGYIYAPYVPLILTPVIYGQEDFSPRRGIMTRYGKKMVRSDFYGTVTVLDMNII